MIDDDIASARSRGRDRGAMVGRTFGRLVMLAAGEPIVLERRFQDAKREIDVGLTPAYYLRYCLITGYIEDL